jgi:hypothetical protein
MTYNIPINVPQIPYGTRLVLGTSEGPCWVQSLGGWVRREEWLTPTIVCILVDVGEGWELVPVKSVVQVGDEWLHKDKWQPVWPNHVGRIIEEHFAPVRRRKDK